MMQRLNKIRSTCAIMTLLLGHANARHNWLDDVVNRTAVGRWSGGSRLDNFARARDYPEVASSVLSNTLPRKLRDADIERRVLADSLLSPWIQPSTFLRVALLIIRNAALGIPGAGRMQSILTTELAYTTFTNLFASFGGAFVSDFSQGLVNEGTAGSAWVVDGETTLENVLASEFVYGGAFGFEQFYGFGFEISGDAAAALQQSLHSDSSLLHQDNGTPNASITNKQNLSTPLGRRRLQQNHQQVHRGRSRSGRRILTDEEAQRRNLPRGAQLLAQIRKTLPKQATRSQIASALELRKYREKRRRVQEVTEVQQDPFYQDGFQSAYPIEGPAEHDLGYMTASWFESFPAALPQSIRDRLVSQLEEFVVDPIVAISLEIAVVFVGVVEPGTGIISAEAADDTTFTFDVTLHGFDAAIDVAADVERGVGVAGSASAGVAAAEVITNAAEIIDAVTDVVDDVHLITSAGPESARRAERPVQAQDERDTLSNSSLLQKNTRTVNILTTFSPQAEFEQPSEEFQPSLKSREEGQIEHVQASNFVQDDAADRESDLSLDYFGPIDYDYEPLGALSGTYAVAVSLIFLEEISLNGGSITIL